MECIQDLCDRIVQGFHPERVILFGSYARGDANEDSDVDLLVIMPFEGLGARKATEIRKAVRPGFPVDIIVRTPETLRERVRMGDFFLRDATEEGVILHDAAHV